MVFVSEIDAFECDLRGTNYGVISCCKYITVFLRSLVAKYWCYCLLLIHVFLVCLSCIYKLQSPNHKLIPHLSNPNSLVYTKLFLVFHLGLIRTMTLFNFGNFLCLITCYYGSKFLVLEFWLHQFGLDDRCSNMVLES